MGALKSALDIRRAAIKSDEKLDDQNPNDYESTDEWDGKPSNVIFHIIDANENTGEDQVDGQDVFEIPELDDEKIEIFSVNFTKSLPDHSISITLAEIKNAIQTALTEIKPGNSKKPERTSIFFPESQGLMGEKEENKSFLQRIFGPK